MFYWKSVCTIFLCAYREHRMTLCPYHAYTVTDFFSSSEKKNGFVCLLRWNIVENNMMQRYEHEFMRTMSQNTRVRQLYYNPINLNGGIRQIQHYTIKAAGTTVCSLTVFLPRLCARLQKQFSFKLFCFCIQCTLCASIFKYAHIN